jgi:hypothetical protein
MSAAEIKDLKDRIAVLEAKLDAVPALIKAFYDFMLAIQK